MSVVSKMSNDLLSHALQLCWGPVHVVSVPMSHLAQKEGGNSWEAVTQRRVLEAASG